MVGPTHLCKYIVQITLAVAVMAEEEIIGEEGGERKMILSNLFLLYSLIFVACVYHSCCSLEEGASHSRFPIFVFVSFVSFTSQLCLLFRQIGNHNLVIC